ncbi:hypothetical protein [Dactylosporangium sp. NPDC051484]|uniref:hypothetical protein n=1 Tax=Dactylosporangium sp. NPDC051484 TaxID=3154942 RepID=UPI00344C1B6D
MPSCGLLAQSVVTVWDGPLAPKPDGERPALPGTVAVLPAHLAAAWQLGRLLALQSKPFAAALFRWKRLRASAASPATPPCPRCPTP